MSYPATLPVLPIELIEHALDYLRGDPKTLAACRLVCRAWTTRARYNLFYIIKLCMYNTPRFIRAVERDPSAAYAVHELTLEGMWNNPKRMSTCPWTANLRTLRLHFMDLHSPWLPKVTQPATNSLTELSLKTCALLDTQELVRFLQLLPQLKHFAASHVIIRARDDVPEKQPIEAFPAVQSLCLWGDCRTGVPLRLLCAFTSATGGLESLSVLTIKLRTRELVMFNDLLMLVAANLRELALTVQPDDSQTSPDGSASPVSLSACRRLSSLKLDVWLLHPGPPTHRGHLNWIVDFLASIRSEDVRRIQLDVRANRATACDLAELDWGGVDRVLSLARFASLRRVVVRVKQIGVDLKTRMEPYVREQMAAVEAKGILRCVQTDSV